MSYLYRMRAISHEERKAAARMPRLSVSGMDSLPFGVSGFPPNGAVVDLWRPLFLPQVRPDHLLRANLGLKLLRGKKTKFNRRLLERGVVGVRGLGNLRGVIIADVRVQRR